MKYTSRTGLRFLDHGSGVPLLWIHGFPLSGALFEPQLAIKGGRHIVPDLPGFGETPALKPDGIDAYSESLIELLDQLGVGRVIVAGLSMGGYVAMSLARLHPQRLMGLILIDTRETPDTAEAAQKRRQVAARVKSEGVGVVVDDMLPKMLTTASAAGKPELVARVKTIMESSSAEGISAALLAMAGRLDSSRALRDLSIPALVIVGEDDTVTPPSDAQRMGRLLQAGEVKIIPGAAHLSNFENPVAFNEILTAFLGKFAAPHHSR